MFEDFPATLQAGVIAVYDICNERLQQEERPLALMYHVIKTGGAEALTYKVSNVPVKTQEELDRIDELTDRALAETGSAAVVLVAELKQEVQENSLALMIKLKEPLNGSQQFTYTLKILDGELEEVEEFTEWCRDHKTLPFS